MAKSTRKIAERKPSKDGRGSEVGEPQATYAAKVSKRVKPAGREQNGYDARRYTGMIPGIAERMKEYSKHMRDDR